MPNAGGCKQPSLSDGGSGVLPNKLLTPVQGGVSPPTGSSPVSRSSSGIPALRASSRAVSIGQRTASPGTPSGRSASLDKCPSLQVPALTLAELLQKSHPPSSSPDPHPRPAMIEIGCLPPCLVSV